MKTFIEATVLLIFIFSRVFASGQAPNTVSGEEDINQRLDQLEKTLDSRDTLRFENLAHLAGYFQMSLEGPLSERQQARVEALKDGYRQHVMTEPGHAKDVLYRLLASPQIPGRIGNYRMAVYNSPPYEFHVLKFIKSHESVCQIARFLEDRRGERGYPKLSGQGDKSVPSLAFWASYTLSEMGLDGIPYAEMMSFGPEILETPELVTSRWVKWWEEIEGGQRTFSFPDDPQVYDINGPVTEEQSARPRPHKDRKQIQIPGKSGADGGRSEESLISFREFSLAAGVLVILGVGLLRFIKKFGKA